MPRVLKVFEQTRRVHSSLLSLEMDVVAAVIERDGLILICQRKTGRHAHKWEFPGGKVEPGESLQIALARELREELAIDAVIGGLMADVTWTTIHLHFFHVTEFQGEPQNLQFEQMVWQPGAKLVDYDFLEGDIAFVKSL